jgi:quercetin dioxygenase-like cupin family protein
MAIYTQEQERVFSLGGNHIAGLATPTRGPGEVEVWRMKMDAGASTPAHKHDAEEVIVMLRGHGRATVGASEVTYGPGDVLILPPGEVHQIFSDTDTEGIVSIPRRTKIWDAEGAPLPLPWRD